MPVADRALSALRYRMHDATITQEYMRSERGASMAQAYAEVAERGPIAAAELTNPGKRSGNWWGWSSGKATLEYLYDSGLVAIAGRRGFERLYDIAQRVIPRAALDAPAPPREEAMKQLICLGAKAYGVGTLGDITGYFMVDGWRDRNPGCRGGSVRQGQKARAPADRQTARVGTGRGGGARCHRVDGWSKRRSSAPGARVPRTVDARALVTPFDSLVWERSRIDRLFGMKYTIELYTPCPNAIYGYYVFPFLLGDTLVGRCDLKADRQRKVLMVQSAFLEPGRTRAASRRSWPPSCDMQAWLQLERIEVADRGDLAAISSKC